MIPQRTASYEEEGRLRPTDTLARKRIRRYLFPPRVCFRTWQLPFAAYPASLSRACAFSLYFFKPFAVPDCFISSFFFTSLPRSALFNFSRFTCRFSRTLSFTCFNLPPSTFRSFYCVIPPSLPSQLLKDFPGSFFVSYLPSLSSFVFLPRAF